MLVHSLPINRRNGLALDVFNTFAATQFGLVYDISNIGCWTQNDNSHGRIFVTFKRGFLTNKSGKTAVCLFSSPFLPLCFLSPLSHHPLPVVPSTGDLMFWQ